MKLSAGLPLDFPRRRVRVAQPGKIPKRTGVESEVERIMAISAQCQSGLLPDRRHNLPGRSLVNSRHRAPAPIGATPRISAVVGNDFWPRVFGGRRCRIDRGIHGLVPPATGSCTAKNASDL